MPLVQLVTQGAPDDLLRLERLREFVELQPLPLDDLQAGRGTLIILPGALLPRVGRDTLDLVLRGQADVILIPPYVGDELSAVLPVEEEVRLRSATFSPCQVVETELEKLLGQSTMVIFYQKIVHTTQGRPLIQSASGQSILVSIQPRSSWGRLLVTTLLLASLSARSRPSDIKAFWSGLLRWLEATAPLAAESSGISRVAQPDLGQELSAVLLAVALAQKDGALVRESLRLAVEQVQTKLSRGGSDLLLDRALAELDTIGITLPAGEGQWQVDAQRLGDAIQHHHLTPYLRRLQ